MSGMEISSFWCYRCNLTVHPGAADNVSCPRCGEGFLEEIVNPNPIQNVLNQLPPFNTQTLSGGDSITGDAVHAAGGDDATEGAEVEPAAQPRATAMVLNPPGGNPVMFQFLEAIYAFMQHVQHQALPVAAAAATAPTRREEEPQTLESGLFNPTLVMQGSLRNFLDGGGSVEVTFDHGTGEGRRVLSGNIGDHVFRHGLRLLIQQLTGNGANRYGTPPASKSAIESLPTICIADEHLELDYPHCAVCKDEFHLGEEVRKMPCTHIYHDGCILPWLSEHSSCPVCRHELPTDDPHDSSSPASESSAGSDSNEGDDIGTVEGSGITANDEHGLPAENPHTMTGERLLPQEVGPQVTSRRTVPENPRAGIRRRIIFQFPWPFRVSDTGATGATTQSETSGTQPETSGLGDITQDSQPSNTHPNSFAAISDIPSGVGANGNDVDRQREQEKGREHSD